MVKKYSPVIFIAIFIVLLVSSESAYAANASRMLGFSARDQGMAGATTASSEDTSCLVKNPAGLVRIGNRIDVSYENILLHDVTMHTEGPSQPALGGASYANNGVRQRSNINYIPGVNAGVSYRIPETDRYPIAIGMGVFTIGGMANNYSRSRLNPLLMANGGNYDKMLDLRTIRVAPGIAAAFNDKLSFGMTANVDMQALRTNLAHSTSTGFEETSGGGKWDITAGAGFTLGLLYKHNDKISLGASYESHGWQQHHHKYEDCLPYIDEPPIVSVGISIKPIKNLELTYDTRYINWTDVKLARLTPSQGGFGWRDQWVFAVGSEYTTFKDKLKLRLGYNYGRSPIQHNVMFANALMPVILEHHITTGFSYLITENTSLDFAWEHHFNNVIADYGGDSGDNIGTGTKVTAAADIITAGLGYKF
ncbi:MAG: outer membrane protein transport protein [Candidatus Omnitrophica bacterium]|nr:outer membrane protein transport protein [Candidatus Omnitrophota bacterium]